jgi:hypothetical protein
MSAGCVGNSSWQESGKLGGAGWGGSCEQRLWQWTMQDSRARRDTVPVLLSRVQRIRTDSFIMHKYVSAYLLDLVC